MRKEKELNVKIRTSLIRNNSLKRIQRYYLTIKMEQINETVKT
jgi:hypothetical protein